MITGAPQSPSSVPLWLPIVVAILAGTSSVVASVLATRAAGRARSAEGELARLRDLENRLDSRKYEVYKPMLDLLRSFFDSSNAAARTKAPTEADALRKIGDFAAWISIYGSDEAIYAFRNMMQAIFHAPPAAITMRLYYEFVLASRRDIGHSTTAISAMDLMGMRLSDLYDLRSSHDMGARTLEELASDHGWEIPWVRTPDGG